ncbi:MAG TPA: hypothetical protein VGB14_02795 [Acidimicrobiales bacterium]|jgi:hypothetical protein
MSLARRPSDDVLGTLREDLVSAADLVFRGRRAYDGDRLLRLAAEAVLARVGQAADTLPDDVASAVFGGERDDWLDRRAPEATGDTRVDHDEVWVTLSEGAPVLLERLDELEGGPDDA